MTDTRTIHVSVNGQAWRGEVETRLTLADFLRHELKLTGTHVGCEHGVCGACTVLVDGASARSCLMLAVQCDGAEVTTVESLAGPQHPVGYADTPPHERGNPHHHRLDHRGVLHASPPRRGGAGRDCVADGVVDRGDGLNVLQQAFRDCHGLQCGFCTPGMLMTLTELLRDNPDPTEAQVRDVLSGNLCRCTGYQGIVDAALLAAKRMREVRS